MTQEFRPTTLRERLITAGIFAGASLPLTLLFNATNAFGTELGSKPLFVQGMEIGIIAVASEIFGGALASEHRVPTVSRSLRRTGPLHFA